MKIQNYNYHMHTTFSDGKYSLEEMLEQAVKMGLEEVAITDHLTIHKLSRQTIPKEKCPFESSRITKAYSLEESKKVLKKQVDYIRKTAKNYPLKVLVSFEIDFFDYPEWKDELNYLISDLNLDFLMTGNHFGIYQDKKILLTKLEKYVQDEAIQKEIIREHFLLIVKAIRSKMFDFVAHLDWVRLIGIVGVDGFREERMKIIKALAETNTPYELNTKGFRRIGEQYPALWMIQELKKRNVPVVVSDDAHRTNEIRKDFDRAEEILNSLNYTNRFKL